MKRFPPLFVVLCLLTVLLTTTSLQGKTFSPGEPAVGLQDDEVELNLGLLFQPRFEYESRESDSTRHTSFSAQRVRAVMNGHAFTPHLNYKLLAEFAQDPTLLEGWVEYRRFEPFVMRMGQMTIPFNYERDLSVSRIQNTDRSLTNSEFNWPSGRDIGFMLSRNRVSDFEYRLGVFGGEGRNVSESNSNGVLTSGRATYEILGEYDRSESFYDPAETPNLSLGSGLLYAYKNTARDWFDGATSDTANVLTGTVDVQLRVGSWNLSGTYFNRTIEHYPETAHDIDGSGFSIKTGYILSPGTLFLNAGHSQTYPNEKQRSTRERESNVGLHLFQKNHSAQTRFEVGQREDHTGNDDWDEDEFVRLQQQLTF